MPVVQALFTLVRKGRLYLNNKDVNAMTVLLLFLFALLQETCYKLSDAKNGIGKFKQEQYKPKCYNAGHSPTNYKPHEAQLRGQCH